MIVLYQILEDVTNVKILNLRMNSLAISPQQMAYLLLAEDAHEKSG